MPYLPLNPDKTPAERGWNLPSYVGPYPANEGVQPPDGAWLGRRADDLVIVDCDSPEAAQAWIDRVGADRADTYTVKTPRGFHLYYRWSPGSPTGPAVGIMPHVDIRAGSGSYVVSSYAPGYEILNNVSMMNFDPAWVPEKPKVEGDGEGWDMIPEGTRNDTLAAIAGILRAKGMAAIEIAKTLSAMNATYCDPPLEQEEVILIAKSIGRYEPEDTTEIVIEDDRFELEPDEHTATGMWGYELEAFDPPPLTWIVPDLIPEGLTILAGKPKVGKSWLSLGVAAAVAEGSAYLDRDIEAGTALYLALEDTLPRLKRRLALVQGDDPFPASLRVETRWPKCPDAATQIVAFIKDNPETRLVIIDTLAKVRQDSPERAKGTYLDDYDALGDLKTVADHFHIAVVVIHHTRKDGAEDVLDQVSGTTGLAGAADTILVLTQDRLEGRGRDLEKNVAYDVALNDKTLQWNVLGASDFEIVIDMGAWLLEHAHAGDRIERRIVEGAGLWAQETLEREWRELGDSPRFRRVLDDPNGPYYVEKSDE